MTLQADEAADDSDKEFAVPAGQVWQVLSIWVELTTTGTAGDRQLAVQVRDGSDDVVAEVRPGATQAASLTRNYLLAGGLPDLTSFRDTDLMMTPLPMLLLPEGWDVRIYDNNGVDAAADDMVVQMQIAVQER